MLQVWLVPEVHDFMRASSPFVYNSLHTLLSLYAVLCAGVDLCLAPLMVVTLATGSLSSHLSTFLSLGGDGLCSSRMKKRGGALFFSFGRNILLHLAAQKECTHFLNLIGLKQLTGQH